MMKFKINTTRNKLIVSAIITLVIASICFLLKDVGLTDSMNKQFFDYKTNLFAGNLQPDSNIVMVVIDQSSLDYFEKNAISWPWPRSFYGIMLDYLKKEGAGSVLFDIDFSSNEVERLETEANSSQSDFTTAIKNYENVILISSLERRIEPSNTLNSSFFSKENFSTSYNGHYNSSVSPIISFQQSTRFIGVANMEKDRDGIIRTVPLVYNFNNRFLLNAAFCQFIIYQGKTQTSVKSILSNVPVDDSCRFTVNWYGPGLQESRFKYYPFYSIFAAALQEGMQKNLFRPDCFRNKTVIVGGAAFGLLDYKPVPIWNGPPYPGMEIHATVLSNLTQKHFIQSVSRVFSISFALILSLLISISIFLFTKKSYAVAALVSIFLVYVGIDFASFALYRINFGSGDSILSLVLTTIASSFFAFVLEGKEKRNIKKIFSRYLSSQVISELMNNPTELHLTGKDAEVTVFFSDIENFTTISEKLNPRELVDLLNSYFSFVSEIILSYEAMLDKYIGDSVMAIFGAPLQLRDHAVMACKAAIEIRDASKKFNSGKDFKLKTRIGINTGKVVLGNVGSKQRLDYTAIGDTVNVASRLESINKYFGTELLISESTYELVKEMITAREIDLALVKGKEKAIRIYELLGVKGNILNYSLEYLSAFETALNKYRDGKYDEAKDHFGQLQKSLEDPVVDIYIKRIDKIKNNPGSFDTEGVHIFLNK